MAAVVAWGPVALADAPAAEPPALPDPEPEIPGQGVEADYLRAIHARVHTRWNDNFLKTVAARLAPDHPLNAPELQVAVALTVAANGAVVGTEIESSSGLPDFDRAAREVLLDSGPMPAPPVPVLSDDERVHLRWTLARGPHRCGQVAVVQQQGPLERAVPWLVTHDREGEAAVRLRAAPPEVRPRVFALWARAWLEAAARDPKPARAPAGGGAREPALPAAAAAVLAAAASQSGRVALIRLTPLLRDPSVEVRAAAIAGMLQAAGESSVEQLYLLFKEKDPRPYQAAAAGLARLSSEASAQLLVRMLGKPDPQIRLAAAAALAARSDAHAGKALAVVQRHPDPQVRLFAAALMDADLGGGQRARGRSAAGSVALYRALVSGSARVLATDWLLTELPRAPAATRAQLLAAWAAASAPEVDLAAAPAR
jgi:hypothetical protein